MKSVALLQTDQRHSHSTMVYSLGLPFLLGLTAGCVVVFLGSTQCWPGPWKCWTREVSKAEVLLQVAPSSPPQIHHHHPHLPPSNVSSNHQHTLPVKKQPTGRTRRQVISVVHGCPDRPLNFVILILSAPGASLRRTAIRGTWAHDYRNRLVQVTTKFLVGMQDLDEEVLEGLQTEQDMFGDVLFLSNLRDSYTNLSAKVLLGMKWADENIPFDYLIKVDDDSYVRIEGLSDALRAMDCDERLYWGYFMGHAVPEPTGKWAEKNWLHCPHYLPYAMGGGYVLSRRAVELITRSSEGLILYHNEDVSVANWLSPYRLTRRHDLRFDVESLSHGCNNGYLISHKERVRSFYVKYTSLVKSGLPCPEEKEVRPAYIYNWTASPMDCCQRVKGIPVAGGPI